MIQITIQIAIQNNISNESEINITDHKWMLDPSPGDVFAPTPLSSEPGSRVNNKLHIILVCLSQKTHFLKSKFNNILLQLL